VLPRSSCYSHIFYAHLYVKFNYSLGSEVIGYASLGLNVRIQWLRYGVTLKYIYFMVTPYDNHWFNFNPMVPNILSLWHTSPL